jgi:hypothetical protein
MTVLTKNDKAWQELFGKYNILEAIQRSGRFEIEANTINTVREARLMAKFDHFINLPQIFKENQLTIFPASRSKYVIGKFESYWSVRYDDTDTSIITPPSFIESIKYNNLYSESLALHYAYLAGIMDDIAGERTFLTVSGRMSSNKFDFKVRNVETKQFDPISVDNSQCEIDGGYESENSFIIVEAKNYTVEDFLIRQLYYPYRLWEGKLRKTIIPVFMTYSNDCFTFFVFSFDRKDEYNSIKLVKQLKYTVAPDQIELRDIISIFHNSKIKEEPAIPFPQADKFERVIDLLGLLYENDLTKDFITQNYQFDVRQTDYYTNAAIYLGLVSKHRGQDDIFYSLTDLGRRIIGFDFKNKYLSLVKCILEHEVFYKVLGRYFELSNIPDKQDICNIMRSSSIYGISADSHNTIERRAQTVLSWVDWILGLQNE